ncbi:MAG: RagB/SusD family nutrient uptake outer membrane protein [Bacteroidota bacterium]
MKIKYIMTRTYLALAFFLIFLSACNQEEFFELTNPPEFPWLNMEELERGVVSPYSITFSSSWGNNFGDDRLIFECMSDLVYLLPNTSADIPFEEMYFRWTEDQMSKANSGFRRSYLAITHTNSVLGFLETTEYRPYEGMTTIDFQNIDRIQGEMLFMRAYTYFYLARRNAPVPGAPNFTTEAILPLRLKTPVNAIEANSAEYVTTDIIYNQIISDLQRAKELLPEAFDAGIHHPSYSDGRATKYAATAMLARVYFQLGDMAKALSEVNEVIAGPFDLTEDPIEAFNKDTPTKGREVIWSTSNNDPVIVRPNKIPTSMNWSDYRVINGGRGAFHRRCTWNQFPLAHSTLQRIGWMDENLDVTAEAQQDKRYQQLFWRLEGNPGTTKADPIVYEMQYPHIKDPMVWGDKYYRANDGQRTNIPVIRLAEMLLTRAIIQYQNGNITAATEDVNLVRTRAGLAPLDVLTEEAIHQERIKELCFEGDWFHYVQALNLPIMPGERDADEIAFPYANLYWQLPQSELDFKTQ